MTITFQGHVDSIKNSGRGSERAIELTLIVEAKVSLTPIVLIVPAAHAQAYLPGVPIQVTIYPLSARQRDTEEK